MTALLHIVTTSDQVAATRSRRAKVEALARCLRGLPPAEVRPAVALLSGQPRQGRLGVGGAAVRELRGAIAPAHAPELSVLDVDRAFDRLQAIAGTGSRQRRLTTLGTLFGRATADEQRFLAQLLTGGVRQGALEGLLMEAIATAADVPPAAVRRAVMCCGDPGAVAGAALVEGVAGLSAFSIELFRPLQPMLAQTASSVADALAKLGEVALEWKLDGARIQVHRVDDAVRVYSRTGNDVTAAVPEVVSAALALPVDQFILDGEVIACGEDGAPRPFQVTMRRFGRRANLAAVADAIPLRCYFFDCLHLDGTDLIDRSTAERQAAMAPLANPTLLVPRLVTDHADAAAAFLDAALTAGHEGVMAKRPGAAYESGRRGGAWLKIKPVHTLDLVVLAAEWGSGRRSGWLSNLHLGARNPATGGFVMLGKTFKGLTDETLTWQTQRLQKLEISRDAYTVHVRPELVVEIAFDGVQQSPHYPGGVALRFARVKGYRTDKSAAQADTIERVVALLR